MSKRSLLLLMRVYVGLIFLLLGTIASGQNGMVLSKGGERTLVPYGEGVLVYDDTGDLVASGKLEHVVSDRLIVKGQYRHQVPLVHVGKLVVGPEKTIREDFRRRVRRALVFEAVLGIGIVAYSNSIIRAGGLVGTGAGFVLLWGTAASIGHGIQALGFIHTLTRSLSAASYIIGPDDWQVVLTVEQP